MTDDQEWTTLVVRLPRWLAEALRDDAEAHDMTLSDAVAGCVKACLPFTSEPGQ